MAAYASRLRLQFQQENQQTTSSPPFQPQPNLAIRGRINAEAFPVATAPPLLNHIAAPLSINRQMSMVGSNLTSLPLAPVNVVDSEFNGTGTLEVFSTAKMRLGLPVRQRILPLQPPSQPAPKLTHDINYCDRQQFSDDQLADLHLKVWRLCC